ncbi:MAG: SIMPL domain-containing protein [bacterium]
MKKILIVFMFFLIISIAKNSYAGILSVSSKGSASYYPKRVKLTVFIGSHKKTQHLALKSLQNKVNIIFKKLKFKKSNFKTAGVNIFPDNFYNYKLHKMEHNGYVGHELVHINFAISMLNNNISALLNIKKVQVQNIDYYDNSLLKYKLKAINIAIIKDIKKAKAALVSINKKIKRIKSITIGGEYMSVPKPFPAVMSNMSLIKKTNKTILPGKNKIIENVYIKIIY